MIKLSIINKKYKEKPVLAQTALNIEDNHFIGIKGVSGSGKTTLLSILGLLESFEGTYNVNGEEVNAKNQENIRQKYFSYIFQKPYLIPYMDVYENLIMSLRNEKKKVEQEKVLEIAEFLGISNILRQKASLVSGGEAQRVAIGRAILSDKPIILADEPTGSLDPNNSFNVISIFKNIITTFNKTIVLVTHSNDFDEYFDHIYFIEDGKIYEK